MAGLVTVEAETATATTGTVVTPSLGLDRRVGVRRRRVPAAGHRRAGHDRPGRVRPGAGCSSRSPGRPVNGRAMSRWTVGERTDRLRASSRPSGPLGGAGRLAAAAAATQSCRPMRTRWASRAAGAGRSGCGDRPAAGLPAAFGVGSGSRRVAGLDRGRGPMAYPVSCERPGSARSYDRHGRLVRQAVPRRFRVRVWLPPAGSRSSRAATRGCARHGGVRNEFCMPRPL